MNVYAYNETNRAILWDKLANCILPDAHWILGRDFNKIDSLQDKIGRTSPQESPETRQTAGIDYWRHMEHKKPSRQMNSLELEINSTPGTIDDPAPKIPWLEYTNTWWEKGYSEMYVREEKAPWKVLRGAL